MPRYSVTTYSPDSAKVVTFSPSDRSPLIIVLPVSNPGFRKRFQHFDRIIGSTRRVSDDGISVATPADEGASSAQAVFHPITHPHTISLTPLTSSNPTCTRNRYWLEWAALVN
ncbi:hypothetical protein HZ326_25326 [Fusarium oxysporum f. sp. albedinis]|nr:hypothetical protein HZ326_25326 [Fusarium oxysporum f. sp. albedinis]